VAKLRICVHDVVLDKIGHHTLVASMSNEVMVTHIVDVL
jgi:hypothetical protein